MPDKIDRILDGTLSLAERVQMNPDFHSRQKYDWFWLTQKRHPVIQVFPLVWRVPPSREIAAHHPHDFSGQLQTLKEVTG